MEGMWRKAKRAMGIGICAHLSAVTDDRDDCTPAVFDELCNMLDTGKPAFAPKKGKPCVVIFVGLQGHCALPAATLLPASAFDQLKHNATQIMVPFYGSYMESYPIKIVVDGVERFRKENCDLIIVDTSDRHKQEATLFEEMRQV
ncbi:Signal recognition particle 54 kDa protein 2 [Hordeum vulgare]|nr:Signal recognition particle 54 kDa protein 2 [Hordeum vulgare]